MPPSKELFGVMYFISKAGNEISGEKLDCLLCLAKDELKYKIDFDFEPSKKGVESLPLRHFLLMLNDDGLLQSKEKKRGFFPFNEKERLLSLSDTGINLFGRMKKKIDRGSIKKLDITYQRYNDKTSKQLEPIVTKMLLI